MIEHNEERMDLLISRIVDGDNSPAELDEFTMLADASADPAATWRALAQTQCQTNALKQAVETTIDSGARVSINNTPNHRISAPRRAFAWIGWAAAAAIAVVAFRPTVLPIQQNPTDTATNGASLIPTGFVRLDSPEDALKAYLDEGKKSGAVLGELPQRVVLRQQPAEDGMSIEVVFLRQIAERAVVRDLYSIGSDDAGRAVLRPVSMTPNRSSSKPL